MKKTIFSLVTCLALSSSAFAMDDKIYATVNGENITSNDISVALRDPRINFETVPKEQQKQILNSLVEQKLLSQSAMKSNIPKTNEYKVELEKLKQNLAFQIWMRDLSKTVQVSDSELKKFYKNNSSKFKSALELKASHILVASKKEADDIISTLKKSKNIKSDFTKLAKEKSTGPSGVNGGELGWFTQEKMVPEFSMASIMLKKGEFTKDSVKTQFGYHIIYLDDKKEANVQSFEEVKPKIQQELSQKVFLDMIKDKAAKLKKNAKIEYK
ncbi:MAG: peptidylprolyl isomerase [Campylobacterota bacterium]|nr:peptidylprolyl isomerase [Campylobacterota bacterium]